MRKKYLEKLDINEEEILNEIEKIKDAKSNKDFETADKIRNDLESLMELYGI